MAYVSVQNRKMNVSLSIFQWRGGNVPFYHFYNMHAITDVAIHMDVSEDSFDKRTE